MIMMIQHCFVTCALILFCVSSLTPTQALPLPSYIEPCSINDPKLNECALKSGKKAIPFLLKGDRKYNIPVLDPLEIQQLKLDLNGGLTIAANNVSLRGFKEAELKSVKIDAKKHLVAVEVMIPVTEIIFQYEMNGKVLVLPISGSGDANISLYDTFYTFNAAYELVNKSDGEQYLNAKNANLQFSPKNARIYLGNLFNGDKTLGNNMNAFLNQNWKDVLQELGPAIGEAIAEVVIKIIGAVTQNVPYNEIFLK